MRIPETNELVVNWHVTEACNFSCGYCFAAWDKEADERELWRDQTGSRIMLNNLYGFFSPTNMANPLRADLRWRSVRLSLAGGEPTLLGDRFLDIVRSARSVGFNVSLITNGSRPDVIEQSVQHLAMLGISIDSANHATNTKVGRACGNGARVSVDDAVGIVTRARAQCPSLVIKINTVVSNANAGEDLSELINRLRPDRWKIMRVLSVQTDAMAVTTDDFRAFVERHRSLRNLMTIEDSSDMEQTYIMVDPHGRFFQNGGRKRDYEYSRPIPAVGAEAAFGSVGFRPNGFAARYAASQMEGVTP